MRDVYPLPHVGPSPHEYHDDLSNAYLGGALRSSFDARSAWRSRQALPFAQAAYLLAYRLVHANIHDSLSRYHAAKDAR